MRIQKMGVSKYKSKFMMRPLMTAIKNTILELSGTEGIVLNFYPGRECSFLMEAEKRQQTSNKHQKTSTNFQLSLGNRYI